MSRSTSTDQLAVRRIEVHGTVQGVGFRPFVYRLATDLDLDGWVANAGGYVVIKATGPTAALDRLVHRLRTEAPPRALIRTVASTDLPGATPLTGAGFAVVASHTAARAGRDIPPDIATCDDCLRELFDPADRRHRYPFINCTNCGPRATIIDDLPYDRERTVMTVFPLCEPCAGEYHDPADRRFHAEPVACPACGPQLSWRTGDLRPSAIGAGALSMAAARIAAGDIVAIKGLGGYQLVCDATQPDVVSRLRDRKRRPAKPLAVMVRDLDTARAVARMSKREESLLTSPARPIVLVRPAPLGGVADNVCAGTPRLGVFLPYTPLHHLLLHDLSRPLVVTSGNRADEPIAIDDDAAVEMLGGIADGFLQHNRPIRARYDDSITRVVRGSPSIIRRARGYAPEPLSLPIHPPRPLLGVGAQLKHTFTLAEGGRAVVGPHTGDLEDADTLEAFESTLAHLRRLQAIEPEHVAHDLHPSYLSTQHARRWPARRRVPVQHHHAHVASCAAEHGRSDPFIGVAYDGLGLGDDGTLWGGEVLIASLAGYRRVGRFATAPLPGGVAAVRRPARMALGYLFGTEDLGAGPVAAGAVRAYVDRLDPREVELVRRIIGGRVNTPRASSAGRLFDAVASMLGLCDDATYEGEAAVRLEAAVHDHGHHELPWRLARAGDLWVYDPTPTIAAVLAGVAEATPVGHLAAAFHHTMTAVTVALVEEVAAASGLRTVCLSGGCFQNHRLSTTVPDALRAFGFEVLMNERVPANDGGISYGQVAVAAARLAGG